MCGRFALTSDPALLAELIHAVDETGRPPQPPNYNVAPTATIATVIARHDEPEDAATRRVRLMRWGLLPPWAKAGSAGRPLINARAETVTTSPAFRASARHKRCLVPMDGYYEWMPNPDAAAARGARKTPYYLSGSAGRPLFMAGVWSEWGPAALPTVAIITTDAVGELRRVHDRMPLSIREVNWDRWLDPDAPAPVDVLAAAPDISDLTIREVSTLVNRVANNGPALIEPAGPDNQPVGLF